MIRENIKILIVEDNRNDATLVEYHVKKIVQKPEILCVETFEDFVAALSEFKPDIILSDYKMNGFDGMEVLKYTNENSNVSNFIFITGTINDEELAAQTILSGATGYILKKNINMLDQKLLPYFEQLLDTREKMLPPGYEKMFSTIRAFIDDARKENQTHIDSYKQIRDAIGEINFKDK